MGFKSISKEENISLLAAAKASSIVDDETSERSGHGGHPGQPGHGGHPGQPGHGGHPGQPGHGGHPGQPGHGGHPGQPTLNIRKKHLAVNPPLSIKPSQAQPAVEFETSQPVSGSPFLDDDQPISRQYNGNPAYVWLVPNTNRSAFAFERQTSVFRLVDQDVETREASILRMLLQAQQVFGDGCFELSGDDDFVNLANEIAARNNIVISGALMSPQP